MTHHDSITRDPIYYVTVAIFALLTTVLPALLGQPRFLPIIQTLSLTIFVAITLHRRHPRGALNIMAGWLLFQFVLMTLLTCIFPLQVESTIVDGFAYRGAITAWFFGGASHPNTLSTNPGAFLLEVAEIVVGSLATAGLVGNWILMGIVNQTAYATGILLSSLANPGQAFLVIPYWTLLRIAGYAGLTILSAMPVLTGTWSPTYYWQNHRRLLLVSVGLLIAAVIVELFLPGIVARPPLP